MAQAKAKRAKRAPKFDAIRLLTDDHARVKKLFRAFQKAEKSNDHEAMEDIVTTACSELTVHSRIEEEIFYPAVRAQADEALREVLAEADVEHESVDALVKKLSTAKLDAEMHKANFTVVMEYVKHHVKEEEKEMFPKVRKLRGLDLQELGMQLRARQEELMGEFAREAGHAMDEEEEEEGTPLIAGQKKAKMKRQRGSRLGR